MYFWGCVFAVVLGLTWYFSYLGYLLVLLSCCARWFPIGGSHSKVCETSTQTDCGTDEPQQKSETGHIVGRDEPDTRVQTVQKAYRQSQYPTIHRSLQHMFKCAYTHLVLPWSTAPELGDSQPLHTALLTEFDLIMDEIIYKAKDLDLSVTALDCIQILTQHLRNTKKSEGSLAFSLKAEEIAVVKGFCEVLIHNLMPKHLWEPDVYYCVLQEILAMKALEFVSLLSDPDNLNNLIISQLDQIPAEKQMEEVQDSDREVSSLKGSESSDVLQDEAEEHTSGEVKAKKKGKRLLKMFTKGLNRIKPKKPKLKGVKEVKGEDAPIRMPAAIRNDDTSSNEGSICDNIDTDVETTSCCQEMMEFKLSYEMWKVGDWAVTVTNVQMEENELCFTVHLEEINNPENLHWDVQKNQSDIIHFYNLCKEIGPLPSLSTIVEKPKTEWKKEEAREILEHSLQELVKNAELSNSELVFKFLGPIDWIQHEDEHDEWFWVLLGGIASFLSTGQDDDELSDHKEDKKQHKVMHDCNTSKATHQHKLDHTQPVYTDTLERQEPDDSLVGDGGHLPTPEETSTCTNDGQLTNYTDHFFKQPESADVNIAQLASKMKYIKFEPNCTRQAAAIRITESDEKSLSHCTTDDVPVCNYNGNISKEEDLLQTLEMDKPERKEKEPHPKEMLSQPSGEKKMCSSSELEANKVIFDLLKELSGNSYTFKFMKAVVTPFTQLVNKKVNDFFKKMNPSEAQIASYIDRLCENIWPERPVPQPLPQSSDKNETKQKAMQIMTSKFAVFPINKTDVESVFKMFQNAEENKKLVYMLLEYLLRKFLPGEPGFNVMFKLNVKPNM